MHEHLPKMIAVTAIAAASMSAVPSPAAAAPATCRDLDSATITAIVNGTIASHLERFSIPGAAVSVVAGGETVFAEGFGLAETDGRAFDGTDTSFHIDSVSKVFTATAVMQLVEHGQLDLGTDVNQYLTSFRVEDAFPGQPVTLEHLLTHTAGFEDDLVEPDTIAGLDAYVASQQPDRVRPPGTVHSYSDYGYDLAGHIVATVTGMPYEAFVQRNILDPLGMSNTGFTTDGKADRADLAVGYETSEDGFRPAERGDPGLAPSVGVVSTAADMATFMTAQLTGAAGGVRILDPSTVDLMRATRFQQVPGASGLGLPLAEEIHGGLRLLGHSGEGPGSHSALTLVPQCQVGLFVTYNGDGRAENPLFPSAYQARADLAAALAAALAPAPASPASEVPPAASTDPFAGDYRWTKLSGDDPARLPALLSVPADLKVSAAPGGGLVTEGFSTAEDGSRQRWDPIGHNRFQLRGGSQYLAFETDSGGRPVLATTSYGYYHFVFQRLTWLEAPELHLAVLSTGVLLTMSALAWPVRAFRKRRHRGRERDRETAVARLAVSGSAFAAVALATFSGVAAMDGTRPGLTGLAVSTAFVALGLTGSAGLVVRAWIRGSDQRQIHLTGVLAGALTVFAVSSYYDLTYLGYL